LLSVSDKTGVVELAHGLSEAGWELVSTGGTARALADAGLDVIPIEEVTGFPEMMDGRVKTLHPRVHGGILHRRDDATHVQAATEHGIGAIDMVVVNLYPFEATVKSPGCTPEEAIEKIDIGGPSMVRSAAKNHRDVLVVTDPGQYAEVLAAVTSGEVTPELRHRLAAAAFARTAAYDSAIATWFAGDEDEVTATLAPRYHKAADLRYGENPHQHAAFYRRSGTGGPTLGAAELVPGGKELSYNNYIDADAALALLLDLPGVAAAIIKHCSPCGAAVAADPAEAFRAALAGDPLSAFGGIVALNRAVDLPLASVILEAGTFFEILIAPRFAPEAVEALRTGARWGKNLRMLAVGDVGATVPRAPELRTVSGGLLVQGRDDRITDGEPRVVTRRAPTEAERHDLEIAWVVAKHARSNAISLVKAGALAGCGAGQTSRVGSVGIAVRAAGERARGAALGSDAFFPFPDGIEAAAAAGVTAVIQPGGSVKDDEVIAAADEHGIAMLMTGMRHFRH
jgi:phosphoribosylaminoimidazolecarboxamide formyltransferase/IMP cyclohydrolase